MKCLITGAGGFVGSYLLKELKRSYTDFLGIGIQSGPNITEDLELPKSYRSVVCDIRNLNQVCSIIHEFSPDVIFHLAAQPFVPKAVEDPGETLEINIHGTLNLLESLRSLKESSFRLYFFFRCLWKRSGILSSSYRIGRPCSSQSVFFF